MTPKINNEININQQFFKLLEYGLVCKLILAYQRSLEMKNCFLPVKLNMDFGIKSILLCIGL